MHPWVKNTGRFASGTTLGGAMVGFAEGRYQHVPPLYGTLLYAALWALVGVGLGSLAAFVAHRRRADDEHEPLSFCMSTLGALCAAPPSAAVLVRFIVWRDLFIEAPERKMAALGIGVVAALFVALLVAGVGFWAERRWLLGNVGTPRAYALPALALAGFTGLVLTSRDDAFAHEPRARTSEAKANVILVLADALRADALGAYGAAGRNGQSLTPRLDAFAQEGTVFTRATAQASWTKPAMASIMTSRHVSGHNTMAKAAVLPTDLPTLATTLHKGGVATSAVVTNYNLTSYFGFARGFDEFRYLPPARYLGAPPEANRLAAYNVYRLIRERYVRSAREPQYFYRDARTVNAQALDMLDHASNERNFMWLHYMEAHDPYFDSEGHSWAKVSDPHPKANDATAMRTAYEDGIARFDAAFGELVDALRARHALDHTLVIVMADHGEEFGEHGGFYHGTTLYEEMLHIPLIMHGPRLSPGPNNNLARQIDVAPTVAGYLGVPVPSSWEGQNLFTPSRGTHMSLAEEDHEGNVLSSLQVATEDGGVKLITANADNPRGLDAMALFDLGQDPFEKSALPDGDARALALVAQMRDMKLAAQKSSVAPTETKLDAPARAELRSLGYVQ